MLNLSPQPGDLAYSEGYQFRVHSIVKTYTLADGRTCVHYRGIATDAPSNARLPAGYRDGTYSWRTGERFDKKL